MYINNTLYSKRLSSAVVGNRVWKDRNYRFVQLPKTLNRAMFFKTPETIPEGSEIKILIYRPTSIYITSTFWHSYDYKDSFTRDDWIMLSDEVSIESPNNHRVLERTWKKTFEEFAVTVITLPTSYKKFVGIIFIKGKFVLTSLFII